MKSKKLFLVMVMVLMAVSFALAGCQKNPDPDPDPDPDPTPASSITYTKEDIASWASSNARGKAVVEGDYAKVTSTETSQPYGGIVSPYSKISFKNEVYLTFEDFENSADATIILKMHFKGYTGQDSAYVVSDEYRNLKGTWSVNIADALEMYKTAGSNSPLFYKAGDKDKSGTVISENKVGTLKFAGTEIEVKYEMWVINKTIDTAAYAKFKSIKVESVTAKTLETFSLTQSDMTGVNGKKVTDTAVQLESTFNPATVTNKSICYQSSQEVKVPVTTGGLVSFAQVTETSAVIKAIPLADISKVKLIKIDVLGDIENAESAKAYFDAIDFTEGSVISTSEVSDLLSGAILAKQTAAAGASVAGVEYIASADKGILLNAFNKDDATQAALLTGGAGNVKVSLSVNNAGYKYNANDITVSVYRVHDGDVYQIAKDAALTLTDSDYTCEIDLPYADGGEKLTGDQSFVIFWEKAGVITGTKLLVENKNIAEVAGRYGAQDINDKLFFADRTWEGLSHEVSDGLFKLQLLSATVAFAQPCFQVFTQPDESRPDSVSLDFTKNIFMVIETEDSHAWLNLRFFQIGAGNWAAAYCLNNALAGTMKDKAVEFDVQHYIAANAGYQDLLDAAIAKEGGDHVWFNLDFQYGSEPLSSSPYGFINIKSVTFYYA